MGVMLSHDQPAPGRSRRHGQHARHPDDQACVDALAAVLRYDATGASRCLGRLADTVLAGRLLPAAVALAEAVDAVLAKAQPAGRGQPSKLTVSTACLLGQCQDGIGHRGCSSAACEHGCHYAATGPLTAAGRAPA